MNSIDIVVCSLLTNDVICFVHAEMEKHKNLVYTLYILHSQEHNFNYKNYVKSTIFLVCFNYFETKSFSIRGDHILWEYEIMW
jgi:hypothetical protein